MGNGIRTMGIFAAGGILVALLIVAGFVVGGIQFPNIRLPGFVSNKGRLIVEVIDKPVNLTHLNITIDSLSIQGGEANWTDLQLLGGKPIYFDLLELQNVTKTLSDTEIPAGNYTMIKMHVLTANATYVDGSTVELNVPSDYIKVLLRPHLEMTSEGTITVTIDLEPDFSMIAISNSLNLKPVLKAMVG